MQNEYNFIRNGARVFWNDPAINDYPKKERRKLSNAIWNVFDIRIDENGNIDDDTIVCIASEYGSEAEVYAKELRPAYCHLNQKQKRALLKLRLALNKCREENIYFIHDDYAGVLMALDKSDIEDVLWEEESGDGDTTTIRLEDAYCSGDVIGITDHSLPTGDNNLWIQLKSLCDEK